MKQRVGVIAILIIAILLVIVAVFAVRCDQDTIVAKAQKQHREFVGEKPQQSEIIGTYILSDQTIFPGGVSALQGRQCQLDILADGTFRITNYPDSGGKPFGADTQTFRFISTSGRWKLSSAGTSYGYGPTPKECWGLEFSESSSPIDPVAFTGPAQPYGLLAILGDADSNMTLRFKRQEHPATGSNLP